MSDHQRVTRWSRRTLLKSIGAAAALPLAGYLPRIQAEAATPPKRVIFVVTTNGVEPSAWFASGSTTSFTLGSSLAPLKPYAKDIVVCRGIDMQTAIDASDSDSKHRRGQDHLLTAVDRVGSSELSAGGQSVDQLIAGRIGKSTPFSSYHFGVDPYDSHNGTFFWGGKGKPLYPEEDPAKAFGALFASISDGSSSQNAKLTTLRTRRKSTLDAIKGELGRISAQLSGTDRERFQAHLAAIRGIETGLDRLSSVSAAKCTKPTKPSGYGKVSDRKNMPAVLKLHIDLLVQAMACDLTRVATISIGRGGEYPFLNINDKHHSLGHDVSKSTSARDKVRKIDTWHAQQVAYLIKKLKGVSDGSKTLLDNTLVVYSSNLAIGRHKWNSMPVLLAGSAGGALKTGRYLQYNGANHNDLLTSICHLMGLDDVSKFGDTSYCTGPLKGLIV